MYILCSSNHIYCCSVSHPVLFVIVLFMFMFIKGINMLISCVTIWVSASHGDICLLVYMLLSKDDNDNNNHF